MQEENNNNNNKNGGKGLVGLTNLGNTCFLNSAMQVLSHTHELNKVLDERMGNLNVKPDTVLLVEWNKLRQTLWSSSNHAVSIPPTNFVRAVQRVAYHKGLMLFTGFSQNDLPEFLIFVIDCFHNALARPVTMEVSGNAKNERDKTAVICLERIKQLYEKDYSEIWKLFYGISVSKLTELENHQLISLVPEPFFMLNLPIPSSSGDNRSSSPSVVSLLDCFDLFVQEETMDGDNAIVLEKTGERVSATKKMSFWTLPTLLIIDVKRFHGSKGTKEFRKNQVFIDFPLENLNLAKYVVGYGASDYVYDLYGVCNHHGSVLGGHYTSMVKNADNKWFHFNDAVITEIKEIKEIKTPYAYCFFYRKRASSSSSSSSSSVASSF